MHQVMLPLSLRGCLHPLQKRFSYLQKNLKKTAIFPSKLLLYFPHNKKEKKKKSQRVQNVPNRQLQASTKASKSFPDRAALDQGGREAWREETEAKRN